jgi:hypothetical protein
MPAKANWSLRRVIDLNNQTLVIGGQVGQYACWRIILASQNNFSLPGPKNSDTIKSIVKLKKCQKKLQF